MDRPRAAWGEITIDCRDAKRVSDFWAALLEAVPEPGMEGWFHLGPMVRGGPRINFQPVSEDKVGKARVHLDVWVDDLDAAVLQVEELGGKNTGEEHTDPEGKVVVMTDPEGTEFCLVALPL